MEEDERESDEFVPEKGPASPHVEENAEATADESGSEADAKEPPPEPLEQGPKAGAQPRRMAPAPPPPSEADGEVELEEVPEDLEPEGTEEEPSPSFEPPRGLPGLQPVSDSEPEPEIASDNDEEATLEPVEETSPIAEPATQAAPPSSHHREAASAAPPKAAPSKRSSDDVRKELRDYLNGVRDRLDKGAAAPTSPVDLLDYLGKLSDYLPEREKKRFRGSNERLAMESIKARLAGKKGLRQKVAASFPQAPSRRKEPMTRSLVVDTFSYLKDLAAWHPDKAVGAAMRDRIESIVTRMGRSG